MPRESLPIHSFNKYLLNTCIMLVSLSKGKISKDLFSSNHCTALLWNSRPPTFWREKKKSPKLFFYSSNKSLLPAKVVYFLSLGFPSSTSILLSRMPLSHYIYLCQALPSLNLTFSLTKEIFQNNATKNNFLFQMCCFESSYCSNTSSFLC